MTPELPTRAALLSGLDPAYNPDAKPREPDLSVTVRGPAVVRDDCEPRHEGHLRRKDHRRKGDLFVSRGGLALQDWLWRHKCPQHRFAKKLSPTAGQASVSAIIRGAGISRQRAEAIESLTGIPAGAWERRP